MRLQVKHSAQLLDSSPQLPRSYVFGPRKAVLNTRTVNPLWGGSLENQLHTTVLGSGEAKPARQGVVTASEERAYWPAGYYYISWRGTPTPG